MGEAALAHSPEEAAVVEYFEQNRRHFVRPRGILIWRILLASEPEALALLQQLQGAGRARWSQLAREHSMDEATKMRSGNLGYVEPNGHTHRPQVRVSPLLFQAADELEDGEIAAQPVREAHYFAVLWRRESRPERKQSLSQVRPFIERRLAERELLAEAAELLSALRGKNLSQHSSLPLEALGDWLTEQVNQAGPTGLGELLPVAKRDEGPRLLAPRATDWGWR